MYARFVSRQGLSVLLLSIFVTACMAAPGATTDNDMPTPGGETSAGNPVQPHVGEIEGQGPFAQFIVKYRDNSSTFTDESSVQARADASGADSGLVGLDRQPLKLTWQRRLAVGADVLKAERPLDRDEARKLMQAFASDPQVEYIEIDGIVTHQQKMGI